MRGRQNNRWTRLVHPPLLSTIKCGWLLLLPADGKHKEKKTAREEERRKEACVDKACVRYCTGEGNRGGSYGVRED